MNDKRPETPTGNRWFCSSCKNDNPSRTPECHFCGSKKEDVAATEKEELPSALMKRERAVMERQIRAIERRRTFALVLGVVSGLGALACTIYLLLVLAGYI